ncbi:MAG: hypothetical protein IJW70_10490 [Clostridia bacterium]|nr:hypothetical protein [Clostridia bacterium]
MKKHDFKRYQVLLLVILLCALTALPASANSAESYWEGVSASGVLTTDGECPLVVEHETLTFDIAAFPSPYGGTEGYDASVTAEYTFYNPSDMTVTANLLFPFGIDPYYTRHYDPETGEYIAPDHTEKYGAQVGGAAVQTTVRHSYWDGSLYDFDPAEEMATLNDDYRTDTFLTYDLPVFVYTYRVSGVDRQTYRSARAATYFDGTWEKTHFMIENLCGWSSDENGNAGWAAVHTSDAEITVYVFGEDVGELQWTFFENGSLETKIEGTMTAVERTSTTFGALAMQSYDPASGVAAHDWFNAVVAQLEGSGKAGGLYGDTYRNWDVSEHLLQWYEYKITLAPGERLTNTVTAPLYPNINGGFEPPVYSYEYFLSPASLWKEFGTLDIYINTPYVMIKERKGEYSIAPKEWTKTDAGYELHLEGLPEQELVFTLSSTEDPKQDFNFYALLFYLPILIVLVLALCAVTVLAAAVILIVRAIRRKKVKKQNDS